MIDTIHPAILDLISSRGVASIPIPSISGEWAALIAAWLWSMAAVIFSGFAGRISPLGLNLLKGSFAIGYLSLTLLLLPLVGISGQGFSGQGFSGQSAIAVSAGSWTSWLLLGLSGAIGIGLGDTCYFEALHDLGPHKTLLLKVLAPGMAAVLAWVMLKETLTIQDGLGISITIASVAWVIHERSQTGPEANRAVITNTTITNTTITNTTPIQAQRSQWRGILFALLAAFTEAIGAVLSRMAFLETNVDPLWSTWIRLMGGNVIVLALLVGQRQPIFLTDRKTNPSDRKQLLFIILGVAFFSTYLGIWLQQVALKTTAAAIAQTLGSTSPLFVLLITAVRGKAISRRSLGGAIGAILGIWVLLN